MFDDLQIEEVFRRFVAPDDAWSRSIKIYCRLSHAIDTHKIKDAEYFELITFVMEKLNLHVHDCSGPGQYFSYAPSVRAVGKRMIVHQYAGYDV